MPPKIEINQGLVRNYLLPWVCFDLRKLELGVVWIHFTDLLSGGRAQDFDNLHQLIDPRVAREDWLA